MRTACVLIGRRVYDYPASFFDADPEIADAMLEDFVAEFADVADRRTIIWVEDNPEIIEIWRI